MIIIISKIDKFFSCRKKTSSLTDSHMEEVLQEVVEIFFCLFIPVVWPFSLLWFVYAWAVSVG